MIKAVVKLQRCTTKAGRFTFVSKRLTTHGIAAGYISFYEVRGKNWTAIRNAIAGYDTTGARTMGFSNARPETVVRWEIIELAPGKSPTETSVRPLNAAETLKAMGVE